MLRLCAYDEVIQDKRLVKTLMKGGVAGLTFWWKQDLGELEAWPNFLKAKDGDYPTHVPLTKVPPGVYEVYWEEDGSMEQLVFTDKAIFWNTSVYPIGSGIARVNKNDLEGLRRYLVSAGLRVMAFGDVSDPGCRKYHPYRSTEQVPLAHPGGLPLLGQVDLDTGEIWPLP